jgi:branched-chain amino acid aminotransferase
VIAYVDGAYVPDDEASISVFDRGLLLGDTVYDTTRTYGGRVWLLDEHLERLRRSLRYAEIGDAAAIVGEVREATAAVVERSAAEIEAAGDVWVLAIVTRGVMGGLDFRATGEPTVVVALRRIDFGLFAPVYERGGVELVASLMTRHFQGSLDARVKNSNSLAAARGELKARRVGGGGMRVGVVLNDDGSIAEVLGGNLAIVRGERLVRPPRWQALEGVSLEVTCDLARGLGLEVVEERLALYDVVNADETIVTSTNYAVLPVAALDGIPLELPRTTYGRLLEAWVERVGFDFVAQARERAAVAA